MKGEMIKLDHNIAVGGLSETSIPENDKILFSDAALSLRFSAQKSDKSSSLLVTRIHGPFWGRPHTVTELTLSFIQVPFFKLELVYLPVGKYCVYPQMVNRQAMA